MPDFYWIIYLTGVVLTIVLGIMIWLIEKNKTRHRKIKRSNPKPPIDETEINLYGL